MDELDKCIKKDDFSSVYEYLDNRGDTYTKRLLYNCFLASNPKLKESLDVVMKKGNCNVDEKEDDSKFTRVMLLCNWTSSRELCNLWNKMSKGNGTWNTIKIVSTESHNSPVDWYVVINGFYDTNIKLDLSRTIVFHMEPNIPTQKKWGEWCDPKAVKVCSHSKEYNNIEWHISKTYSELSTLSIQKNPAVDNVISTIMSDKYSDIGHVKRVDFMKFLQQKLKTQNTTQNTTQIDTHVYGSNSFRWENYMGGLPYHCKDNGLFPYKYTFNAENHEIYNYVTEKLIDGILSECLTFYSGCPNIKSMIDERAYVYLELENFEHDYEIIKRAIEEDWWSKRIDIIRKEKHRILNELQFFPRLEKILKGLEKKV